MPADGVVDERPARPGEVKRFGDHPVVARFEAGEATVEVAAGRDDRALLVGPFS